MCTVSILAASAPGVYYAFENSDGVGKGIVVLLLLGSIVTWTVMLDKAMSLYRARKLSQRFLARFRANQRNVAAPSLVWEGMIDTSPIGQIYAKGVNRLLKFYESDAMNQQLSGGITTRPIKLSDAQYNAVEAVLESEVSSQIQTLETRIGLLATLVSDSPFCGLFGTVWGIMQSFTAIAQMKSVSLATVAPGIAEALVATAVGLFVAIPAVCGYNVFRARLSEIEGLCINYGGHLLNRLQQESICHPKGLNFAQGE